MLGQKIVVVDASKKAKIVSEEAFYEKVKLIGQGTFGKVYLALHRKENKQYALKEVLQDKRYKNRELGIIARIRHCNIISMKEYFLKIVKQECYLSIIMDYIPSSLNVLIKDQRKVKKPFPPDVRKIIAFQLIKALAYMQTTKICHRDLKPPNILVDDETFEVKICDFGSAKILQRQENNVAYICSRYYRAPELVMQSTNYGTEIDVWSAGCVIVQLLTLEPIFPGDSSVEQLIEIIKILGTPPSKYIQIYEDYKQIHLNLPKIKPNSWTMVLDKYQPEKELVDLIQKILTYDSQKRIRPFDALQHEYFADLPLYKKYIQKLPHLFYFKDLQNKYTKKDVQLLEQMYQSNEPLKLKERYGRGIKEDIAIVSTPNTLTNQ